MNRFLTFALFALLFCSVSESSNLIKSDKPGDFDFYLFVQQWIYSYCESTSCIQSKIKEAFTIHGLWPENKNGSYPSFCSGPSFNVNDVKNLEDQLNIDWISLTETNEDFWSSEFSKHGTCAINNNNIVNGTFEYFQAGIDLYQKLNLTQALESENIYPSSKSISASNIVSAIQNQFGGKPGMQCEDSKLSTIAMCIDKDDLSIIDCPDLDGWSCDGDIQWPSKY
ncbi:hypothetical protein RB653_004589 [Dictyostelium firmibasis]|uniref:Uncharacterized protein n=1 Tax=Dictyostelium firmibasis TaxID=79012 RepID=A0AAN7TZT3_9MYCE